MDGISMKQHAARLADEAISLTGLIVPISLFTIMIVTKIVSSRLFDLGRIDHTEAVDIK